MSHFTMFQLNNMITTQTTFQRSDLAAASRHHGQNVRTWENPLLEPFYKKSNLLRTEKTLSHTHKIGADDKTCACSCDCCTNV